MLEDGVFIENLEIGNIVYVIIRVCECEFIKDGDTDEVKNTYYCGLRCDHPAAAASFSASLYGFSQTQAKHVQESSSQASDSSQMVYDISLPQSSSSQVKLMAKDMILTATIILVFTALSVGLWIYRSIAVPLVKLKKATKNIKEGIWILCWRLRGMMNFPSFARILRRCVSV